MGHRFGFRLLFVVALLAAAAGAGWWGYSVGVAHGLAQAGSAAAAAAGGGALPGATPVYFYPRPWGFGFGFFPFAPLLFILFWVVIVRALFWRGRWGRGYGRGYAYACGPGGVPPVFDEWHRRAHAQGGVDRPAEPPARA
jgi:hypothetical protein